MIYLSSYLWLNAWLLASDLSVTLIESTVVSLAGCLRMALLKWQMRRIGYGKIIPLNFKLKCSLLLAALLLFLADGLALVSTTPL